MSNRLFWCVGLIVCAACSSEPASEPSNNRPTDDMASTSGDPDMGQPQPDVVECEPQAEVCDGVDNDCDGEVDEDFDVATACSVGLGACAVEGSNVCNDAADGVECDAEPLQPMGEELCGDNVDNDCDGAIDEDFDLGDPCVAGVGVCETAGVLVCDLDSGTTVCDAVPLDPPEPDELSCDQLDNDCDGAVDEGCDDDGDEVCDEAFTVVPGGGDLVCPGGGGDCDDEDPVVYPGAPGICDNKDNDCADGVDDIKRRTAVQHSNPNTYADPSGPNSPIQAIGTRTGMCYFIQPPSETVDGVEGFISLNNDLPINNPAFPGQNYQVADVEWGDGRCGALLIMDDGGQARSARSFWWTPNYQASAQHDVVVDDITHIAPSWDASLAFANDTWVVAWSDTAGSTGSYVTLPADYQSTTAATGPFTVGNNGTFPELGLHPNGTDFLFASNFFNINVRQFTAGSNANSVATLGIQSSVNRSSLAFNQIQGETWFTLRNDGTVDAWELRRIDANLTYDLAGEVPYATVAEPQEYITRNPFVGGPQGAIWFLDTIDEEFVAIADNGAGGIDITEMSDPAANGQLLGGWQVSADVTQLLWLVEPGDPNTPLVLEVAEYTCH